MNILIQDDIKLNIVGEVTVNEILPDGTKKIKRSDKNIVVSDGILLLLNYFFAKGSDQKLSGITHLGVGIGKPDFIDGVEDVEKKGFMFGLSQLKNELFRVVRYDTIYYKKDDFGNMVRTVVPTDTVEFSFRLRQNEPVEPIYISEIGMFGGTVKVTEVPVALLILDDLGKISDGSRGYPVSRVTDMGTMFSYKYYDPPIDKFPDVVLEFVWRVNFLRG